MVLTKPLRQNVHEAEKNEPLQKTSQQISLELWFKLPFTSNKFLDFTSNQFFS